MKLSNAINSLWILIYCSIIAAAFGVQIFAHEEPCPLCYLQRIGMILVSTGALLNLHFGLRNSHLALSLLGALFGGSVALRQIAIHACPGSSTFGEPIWGLSLYSWSFLTFIASIFMVILLLLVYQKEKKGFTEIGAGTKFVTLIFLFVVAANVVSALLTCGLGAC